MNKDSFAQWLETHANLKKYSIGRYANAIDTVSSELVNYGLPRLNSYNISNSTFIDAILSNPKFQKKNEWLAILSTDTSLTVEEIIQIYGIRWDIEVFKIIVTTTKRVPGRSYEIKRRWCFHVIFYWLGNTESVRIIEPWADYF